MRICLLQIAAALMDFKGGGEEDAVPQEETHIICLESQGSRQLVYLLCMVTKYQVLC